MPPREWFFRVKDILNAIERNTKYLSKMSYQQFDSDEKTVDAVIRNFIIIGEAATKLPKELHNQYPDVPWEKMIGMRNFVVHEYFGISNEVLWNTVKKEFPELKKLLKKIKK